MCVSQNMCAIVCFTPHICNYAHINVRHHTTHRCAYLMGDDRRGIKVRAAIPANSQKITQQSKASHRKHV